MPDPSPTPLDMRPVAASPPGRVWPWFTVGLAVMTIAVAVFVLIGDVPRALSVVACGAWPTAHPFLRASWYQRGYSDGYVDGYADHAGHRTASRMRR